MDQNGTTWHKLRDVLESCVAFVFESSKQGRGTKNGSSRSTNQRYPTLPSDLYQLVRSPHTTRTSTIFFEVFQNLGYLNFSIFPNEVCFFESKPCTSMTWQVLACISGQPALLCRCLPFEACCQKLLLMLMLLLLLRLFYYDDGDDDQYYYHYYHYHYHYYYYYYHYYHYYYYYYYSYCYYYYY